MRKGAKKLRKSARAEKPTGSIKSHCLKNKPIQMGVPLWEALLMGILPHILGTPIVCLCRHLGDSHSLAHGAPWHRVWRPVAARAPPGHLSTCTCTGAQRGEKAEKKCTGQKTHWKHQILLFEKKTHSNGSPIVGGLSFLKRRPLILLLGPHPFAPWRPVAARAPPGHLSTCTGAQRGEKAEKKCTGQKPTGSMKSYCLKRKPIQMGDPLWVSYFHIHPTGSMRIPTA